ETGLGRAGADLHVSRFAALEQDHGRDGADAILAGGTRVLIDIELDDLDLAGQFGRELAEHGRNCAPWPAPLSPAAPTDGLVGVEDFLAKIGIGNMSSHGILPFVLSGGLCAPKAGACPAWVQARSLQGEAPGASRQDVRGEIDQ